MIPIEDLIDVTLAIGNTDEDDEDDDENDVDDDKDDEDESYQACGNV